MQFRRLRRTAYESSSLPQSKPQALSEDFVIETWEIVLLPSALRLVYSLFFKDNANKKTAPLPMGRVSFVLLLEKL
ncbi:MAG: hypothetical protein IJU76_02400 [Desulfovibrionaceae bacterium]|nr:hypothetical protein [Desulfovibrionaceae bacterium]